MTPTTLANAAACYCFNDDIFKKVIVYLLDQINSGGGGGSVQDMQVAWTPTNLKLGEEMGFFAFTASPAIPGITSLIFNQSSNLEGFDIEGNNSLTSISFPNLTQMIGGGYIQLTGLTALTSVSFPLLINSGNVNSVKLFGNTSLPSVSLPSLTTCLGVDAHGNTSMTSLSMPVMTNGQITANGCPLLTSLVLSSWTPAGGISLLCSGCAFPAATVNAILHRCVGGTQGLGDIVDVSGGTSSTPTGQGIADKATLQGRGVTVNTN